MYHMYQYDKQSDHYCRKVGNDHETTGGHQMAASLSDHSIQESWIKLLPCFYSFCGLAKLPGTGAWLD